MNIYVVDGKRSLCPFCVTTKLGYSLKRKGHQEECPVAILYEQYNDVIVNGDASKLLEVLNDVFGKATLET